MKKVNAVRPKNENNFLRLLLSIKLAEYKIAAESFSEIVLFLVQYSFLFEDTEKLLNSCASEQTQLYTLQENRDLGARYLDPKYSLWKSTDPALGEYIPQAGSDNSSLPGMGGVYNYVNLNLYHYAGNNPIRYIDPDGREEIDWIEYANKLNAENVEYLLLHMYEWNGSRMGGHTLSNYEIFDYLITICENNGLMGKKYSQEKDNVFVCTTFVAKMISIVDASKDKYLPGGQKVVDSISLLKKSLTVYDKDNVTPGTYIFYFDYNNKKKQGHTGFVHFAEDGTIRILHNGGTKDPRVQVVTTEDFFNWFGETNGTLYIKKFEVEICIE